MGMRKYKRQIARGFMTDAGIGNVNRKMHIRNANGVPMWREALKEHCKLVKRSTEAAKRRKTRKTIRKAAQA